MFRSIPVLIFLAIGCGHTVPDYTVEGASVQVTQQQNSLRNCERVGPISVRYGGGGFERNNWIAMRKLLNTAGLSKVTHLTEIKMHDIGNLCGRNCVEMTAMAYRCTLPVVSDAREH